MVSRFKAMELKMKDERLSPPPKLSICITTLNRASSIGSTLDSILPQLTDACELVILDANSSDHTQQVVTTYASRTDRLRYIRQEANNGLDRDYDRVVQLAKGEFCWLMTDDDLLKPGSVSAVLEVLREDLSLVIVNVERKNYSLTKVVQRRWLDVQSDRVYRSEEMDRLFYEASDLLCYIGCVVIRRSIWLERERERYFGSWYVYFGVIFQRRLPGDAHMIATPLITYRMGNIHTFWSNADEILFFSWPSLFDSLAISESVRKKVYSVEPWRHFRALLLYRAMSHYSLTEYRRWVRPHLRSFHDKAISVLIALFPGILIGAGFALYCSITGRPYQGNWWPEMLFQYMKEGRYRPWR